MITLLNIFLEGKEQDITAGRDPADWELLRNRVFSEDDGWWTSEDTAEQQWRQARALFLIAGDDDQMNDTLSLPSPLLVFAT